MSLREDIETVMAPVDVSPEYVKALWLKIEAAQRLAQFARDLLPGPDVVAAAKRLKMIHDGKGKEAYASLPFLSRVIQCDEAKVICHSVPHILKAAGVE